MKIIHRNLKKGLVKVHIQSQNDLWFLSHILDVGDHVSGSTQRKIKTGDEGDRSSKTHIKKVFLKLQAEKIEFHKYSDKLRVSGKITEGPEDIARGSYHTLTLEPTVDVTIEKERWLRYQLDKLNDAAKDKDVKVMICLLDRDKVIFAQLKNYGFDVLSEFSGNVQKKDSPEKVKSSFYADIVSHLKEYDAKNNYSKIIIASPAFWKEYMMQALEGEPLRKKVISASCNSVDIDGINEVLKRPEVATALEQDRVVKEMAAVEELLVEIKKDGLAVYGLEQTGQAVRQGAVRTLLVADSLIRMSREDGTYERLDRMLSAVDSMKGEVAIISSEHDGGKKLEGLGGIGAILRYKTA